MSENDVTKPSLLLVIATILLIALLIVPMLVVFPVSLTDRSYLSLPQHGLSLAHYGELITSAQWLKSFAQSAAIGSASTALSLIVGVSATIGCWMLSARQAGLVRALMLLPLVVPSVVYALGLYRFYIPLGLIDTYTGVILAHAVTGLPYVVITTAASLASFDPSLIRAARGLGASQSQALRMVLLPNITPGIASGAILAFMHSWDEIVIVLFIASRSITTVPRRIWDGINDQLDPIIASVATVMILISIAFLVVNARMTRDKS